MYLKTCPVKESMNFRGAAPVGSSYKETDFSSTYERTLSQTHPAVEWAS